MENLKNLTIFHIAENYLTENYNLRLNTISLSIEIAIVDTNEWRLLNEDSLWLEMQKDGIKISMASLLSLLRSDFVEKYNPIESYFKSLKSWSLEVDYIKKFTSYVHLADGEDREQFEYHFKKWCVRVVKCTLIPNYFNKQAFIITDDGVGQNSGKTSWCRFLCPKPLEEYIAQNLPENEKDARILLVKNFLVNLDELDSLSRKDINKLKSYFTIDKINDRLPFDRRNSILKRIASFVGSTNMSTFLHDETGSVRWLCFIAKSIDWSYRTDFNIDDLWRQAFHLANDKNFQAELSAQDIKLNELRNDKFQISTPEIELVAKYFETPLDTDQASFFTATDVLNHINIYSSGMRLHAVSVGKALKKLGFEKIKINNSYGYYVNVKNL